MIRIERTQFFNALKSVATVIPKKTPKEVLKNFLLYTRDGKLYLYGTDGEISIEAFIETFEDRNVQMLLPMMLLDIVREVRDETIELDDSGGDLRIVSSSGVFELQTADVLTYAKMDSVEIGESVEIDTDALRSAIMRTVFSVDEQSTRYALAGVLIDFSSIAPVLASTDSRRLSVCGLGMTLPEDFNFHSGVVPAKAIKAVGRALAHEPHVLVSSGNNRYRFETGETVIETLQIEGRFPDYRAVIPEQYHVSLPVVASDLLSAVRQALIVTVEESHGVELQFADDTLSLKAVGAEVGEASIEVPVAYQFDAHSVTLNGYFLKEYLQVVADQQVMLKFNRDNASPVVIETGESRYVIMPMSSDS